MLFSLFEKVSFRWKIHWTIESNSEPNKGNKSTKRQSWTTSDSFSFILVVLHASFILPEEDAWANLVHCCSWNQWLICLWFHLTLYVSYFKLSIVSRGHATRPLMAAQCTIQCTTKSGILMSTVVEWNIIKMMSIQFSLEAVLISPKYKLVPVSYQEFKYGQFLIFQIRSNAFHTVPS